MRIRGYGRGLSGHSQSGRERAAAFRKRYRVGDMLTGKLVRWESQDLGWVLIEGLTLLASISSSPAPGESLTFLVKSLTPDIVLQELHGQGGGAGFLMGSAVQDFHRMRSSFESKADALLKSLVPLPMDNRARTFSEGVTRDRKLLGPYLEMASMQAAMNQALSTQGSARFIYAPWLVPNAREHEALYRRSASKSAQGQNGNAQSASDDARASTPTYHELIHCLRHRTMGLMQLRFLNRPGLTAYRLHLGRPEHRETAAVLAKTLTIPGTELRLLGVERIHKYAQGGVLTELLSANVHSISGFTG